MENDATEETGLFQLADVLATYATPSSSSTREEEYVEKVEKEVIEEQIFTETETVDRGPHIAGSVLIAIGIVALTGLIALGSSLILAIAVSLFFLLGGGACLIWLRKTEEVAVEKTEEVPRTIVEHVTRTRVAEETSPATRILQAGSASLHFHVTETLDGPIPQGPDVLTDTFVLDVPTLGRPQIVYDATESIQDIVSELPWVLDGATSGYSLSSGEEDNVATYTDDVSLRGEERALRHYFEGIEAAFATLRTVPMRIQALADPQLFTALNPVMNSIGVPNEEAGGDASSLEPVFDFFSGPHGKQLEAFARSWESNWTRVTLALLEVRSESLFEQVGPDCYELGQQIGYATFNFYCPYCNQEQQNELLDRDYDVHDSQVHEPIRYSDTTRCLFRPEDDVWECRTCERTSEDPIPIHRMLDDVLFPAYDHLMGENKNERLRIHAKARDQERDLQEKVDRQLDEIYREHMSKIFSLSEEMERFEADISGEHDAIASMKTLLREYGELQDQSVQQIEAFTRQVKDEIQDRTQTVLNGVDAVKEREMGAFRREMNALAKAQHIEDLRRDRLLHEVAQNTKRSAEANERSASANERSASAGEQQVEEQQKTRSAITDQTESIEQGHTGIEKQLTRQTAIRKAEQRKLGLETDDYSSVMNPIRSVKDTGAELRGKVTGRAQEDIERDKLGNA